MSNRISIANGKTYQFTIKTNELYFVFIDGKGTAILNPQRVTVGGSTGQILTQNNNGRVIFTLETSTVGQIKNEISNEIIYLDIYEIG